jgi:hypothetical protein
MSATKQLFCLKQTFCHDTVEYNLLLDKDRYLLKDSGVTVVSRGNPTNVPIEKLFLPIPLDIQRWSIAKDPVGSNLYHCLKEYILPYFDVDDEIEASIVSLFILLTYVHQIFETLPILSFHVRQTAWCHQVESILYRLCFNAHSVNEGYSIPATSALIEEFQATLIFPRSSQVEKGKLNIFVNSPNHRRRTLLHETHKPTYIYSPKVIISDRPIYLTIKSHTIPIYIGRFPQKSMKQGACDVMRGAIFLLMYQLAPFIAEFKMKLSSQFRADDIRFPFLVILNVLKEFQIITDEEAIQIQSLLDSINSKIIQGDRISIMDDVIFGLSMFLEMKGTLSDEYYCLDSILDFLRYSKPLKDLTQNKLSRILARYQLSTHRIRKPEQINIKSMNVKSSGNIVRKKIFRPFVKLDIKRINKLNS